MRVPSVLLATLAASTSLATVSLWSQSARAQDAPAQPPAQVTPPDAASPAAPAQPEVTPPQPTPPEPSSPVPTPPAQTPPAQQPNPEPQAQEPQVLVGEVVVVGAPGPLEDEVYRVIRTQAGRTTTRSQLQQDINAVFATGFFANVEAVPEDTPLGVRVSFIVTPNPVLQAVQVQGGQAGILPPNVVDNIFRPQYGSTLNFQRLQQGVRDLEKWYQDNGYVLAQVVNVQATPEGVITLTLAEGQIENIQVRFLNDEGQPANADGTPVRGRTRDFVVTRELRLKPGDVFNGNTIRSDLQRVFGLGLFDDVQLSLNPGQEDARKVVVTINVDERRSGSLAAGAGFSSASGLFGTASFSEQNLGGNNQKLSAEVQAGFNNLLLFDLSFTDPWIGGDPFRTGYTVNLFNRRSLSFAFAEGDRDVDLDNGDSPRVNRLGLGINFTRPLSGDPLNPRPEWTASAGLTYQRVSIRDADNELRFIDEAGEQLSFSDNGRDDLTLLRLSAVRDLRDSQTQPTRGSVLQVSTEQSVPVGSGSILLNRLRASYSYFIPVRFTRFAEGPQALAFNLQGGTVLGDLPPYEAFTLGGSSTVRGFEDGEVATSRSFVLASVEYRFPIFNIINGVLFADYGTALGSQGSVPGDPGITREKPGSGFGYGIGLRIRSPLGSIRIDYGIGEGGEGRFSFGLGEKF